MAPDHDTHQSTAAPPASAATSKPRCDPSGARLPLDPRPPVGDELGAAGRDVVALLLDVVAPVRDDVRLALRRERWPAADDLDCRLDQVRGVGAAQDDAPGHPDPL